ncbi:MAG: DUF547 domain-containing protein [Cyanobacteria bacterium P01_H01_bin.15]
MGLDFELWGRLLSAYVDNYGQVNYCLWKREAQSDLTNWLLSFRQLEIYRYDRHEQLALWLNLYNALVIREVLNCYPVASIRPRILGVPNWTRFYWFFARPIFRVRSRRYSLNDIEHRIIRPQFRDPRVHFALVCAARGCPWLRQEAYQPEIVLNQLEEDAHRFINNPQKLRHNVLSQRLICSPIFRWYKRDFLSVADSLPAYIHRYLHRAATLSAVPQVTFLKYDWSLNQRISW